MAVQGVHTTTSGHLVEAMDTTPAAGHGRAGGCACGHAGGGQVPTAVTLPPGTHRTHPTHAVPALPARTPTHPRRCPA